MRRLTCCGFYEQSLMCLFCNDQVWSALLLYQQILDAIEANDYDNFTKRAYVNKWKKFATLPMAYGRALLKPPGVQARSAVQSL